MYSSTTSGEVSSFQGAGYGATLGGYPYQGAYGQGPQGFGETRSDFDSEEPTGKKPRTAGKKRKLNIVAIVLCFVVPSLIFTVVFATVSFSLHYRQPGVCACIVGFCFALVFAFGALALVTLRKLFRGDGDRDPTWYLFLFFTALLAACLAYVLGDLNFWHNMQPYYDIEALDTYKHVAPSKVTGQSMMDAGLVEFSSGTHLDLTNGAAFKNEETYCVAPITDSDSALASYDFWAVGLNCCNSEAFPGFDFRCGLYDDATARAGLRLVRNDQRAFYRLAVQQAAAKHGLKAQNPLFFYWVKHAGSEMNSYMQAGWWFFYLGFVMHFALQLVLVLCALAFFAKAT